MLGLRAWGDDLNVVMFEFLDDDTKLAHSCTDWLYVQHWYTVVPDPAMRVTLWALVGVGDDCNKRTLPAQLSISVLCFMQLHHQTTAVTGASLRRCGTTGRFVMLTNTFLRSLFVVSVGTPGRLSLHRVTVRIRRGLRFWQGTFLHLFWYCRSFVSTVRYIFSIHTCRSCHFQFLDVSRAVGGRRRGCCSATSSTTPSSC